MSGLGGNLTYPANKQFRNTLGTIANPGAAGQEFRLITDLKAQAGVTGAKTLFMESTGDYIPGGAQASYTRVDHADSVARVTTVVLENRGPIDESTHELGFTVEAIAQHPGVFNDNLYGQRRTYVHKFDYLDPVVSGIISDLDLQRAYADISNQILVDTGRYSGGLQGNVESVVDAVQTVVFSADVSTDYVYWPATGVTELVSAAKTATRLAGTTTITLGAGGEGGFVITTSVTSATVVSAKLVLTTKSTYKNLTTFNIEKLSGTFTINTAGNFELLPWAEVWREFSHMAHDTPLSNMHSVEKPSNANPWTKFILESGHRQASIHGASHSGSYLEQVVLFVPDVTTNTDALETLLTSWSS
jgi:hypothetical protein